MRGKLPMPSEQRKLTGAPKLRPRRRARRADQGDALIAPASISPRAFEFWGELMVDFDRLGLLDRLDSHMLGLLCQNLADHEAAIETLEAEGKYYTTANGLKRLHPAVREASRAAGMIARLSCELGLTPRSRAVLPAERVPGDGKSTGDSWCRFAHGPDCLTPTDCTKCKHYDAEIKRHDLARLLD